jgi:hypothetical protein
MKIKIIINLINKIINIIQLYMKITIIIKIVTFKYFTIIYEAV